MKTTESIYLRGGLMWIAIEESSRSTPEAAWCVPISRDHAVNEGAWQFGTPQLIPRSELESNHQLFRGEIPSDLIDPP